MLEYGLSANGVFAPKDSNVDMSPVLQLKTSHANVFHRSLLARFTKYPLLRQVASLLTRILTNSIINVVRL